MPRALRRKDDAATCLALIVEVERHLEEHASFYQFLEHHKGHYADAERMYRTMRAGASRLYAAIAGGHKARFEDTSSVLLGVLRDGNYVKRRKRLPPSHPVWSHITVYIEDK